MLGNAGIYAVKKRKKPVQKSKKQPGSDAMAKSNPSKRHRDRLNGELDRLTGLLPFPEEVRTRLDKLSVLRLSVGYLKVKSFFKATMKKNSVLFPSGNGLSMNGMDATRFSEGDMLLQSLNGFVLVVTAEGHVFYASPTIQDYLGFHQSDVVHQSVFELIHTDDRALFRRQLHFALNPKPFSAEQGGDGMQNSSDITRNIVSYNAEQLPPENSSFLERSFVCRFRCLLDNSSGFLALNFQGRLKFLHGQSMMGEDGTHTQPRLALFTIATPVQVQSILEIRTKTIIFQTKHKLDFTPMGIDTRGKVVLGYTELELCMRGSGYQFIHAADMMYCADNHVRMIKTGESGLTAFRLLTKTGVWVWVQANAKLIFKGGRPDFIIARQRALVNAEGEEHLRQRKMQLPFSFATGEALLYETGPTLDATEIQANSSAPKIRKVDKTEVDPSSLLGSLLKQDESAYTQQVELQLPVDQIFMESRALVNRPSDPWQAMGSAGHPVGVKEEGTGLGLGEESVVAMIQALEKMATDGDLCSALQGLDVDTAELMEWESALLRLNTTNGGRDDAISQELDDILTNDIFSYVEDALFKERMDGEVNSNQPINCLGTMNNNQGELLSPVDVGLSKPEMLQSHSFNHTGSPLNGLPNRPIGNGLVGMARQDLTVPEPNQTFSATHRLSHFGPQVPQTDLNIPTLQQLQLNDIFTPSLELPELSLPATSGLNGPGSYDTRMVRSCSQAPNNNHIGGIQGIAGQVMLPQRNGMQALMTVPVNGQQQSSSVQLPNHVGSNLVNGWPSVIPTNAFVSPQIESSSLNVSNPFPTACLQGSAPFQTQKNQRVLHQWPQNEQQQQPPLQASTMQSGYKLLPGGHSQASETQRLPPTTCLWPQNTNTNGLYHPQQHGGQNTNTNGLYHPQQQGGLTNGHSHGLPTPSSSCMFENSPPLPNSSHVDGTGLAPPLSLCQRRMDVPQDQSPPQGSCYFQWGPSEPVVGTSAIAQQDTSMSPPSRPLIPNMASPEDLLAMQHYLGCNGQTQIPNQPTQDVSFSLPPLTNGPMYFSDHSQTNCCKF